MTSLLDIWDYEAFQLRGLMALHGSEGGSSAGSEGEIDYWEVDVGNDLVAVWLGAATPQLDLWMPHKAAGHHWNWKIAYLGTFENVCAVLGLFVWWHCDR